jgi:hypothetical protein
VLQPPLLLHPLGLPVPHEPHPMLSLLFIGYKIEASVSGEKESRSKSKVKIQNLCTIIFYTGLHSYTGLSPTAKKYLCWQQTNFFTFYF